MKRCRHTSGWLTVRDACVFVLSSGRVGFITGRRRNDQLLMKCNLCPAQRFAYFADDGSFVKFGKVHRYIPVGK